MLFRVVIYCLHIRLIGAGAAYGTAKSGIGIAGVGTFRPDLIMKASSASVFTDFSDIECHSP